MTTQPEEVIAEEIADEAAAVHAKIINLANEVGDVLDGYNLETVAGALGLHMMQLEQALPGIVMQIAHSAIEAATAKLE